MQWIIDIQKNKHAPAKFSYFYLLISIFVCCLFLEKTVFLLNYKIHYS